MFEHEIRCCVVALLTAMDRWAVGNVLPVFLGHSVLKKRWRLKVPLHLRIPSRIVLALLLPERVSNLPISSHAWFPSVNFIRRPGGATQQNRWDSANMVPTAMWTPPERIRHPLLETTWPSADEARGAALFSSIRIGPIELRHRTWVPAMVPWRATEEGFVTREVLDWYERFARGQPGAIVVEATGIRDIPSGPLLRIGHDRFVPGLCELVETVRVASEGQTRHGALARDRGRLRHPRSSRLVRAFGCDRRQSAISQAGRSFGSDTIALFPDCASSSRPSVARLASSSRTFSRRRPEIFSALSRDSSGASRETVRSARRPDLDRRL